ncbi:MAG: tRNA 2-thiouridine(34) synthase MnmA [Clostridia bacterium]|nr:tRNA 2-thiouridine(34) synthase MnmA [Clostridia bacterium]
MAEKVVVGMSGGVDSSVAALLLKQQGFDVVGLFMLNWEESDENGACGAEGDFEDVRRVCDALGMPYYSVNFAKQYRESVFSHFLSEYENGRTPNPDVLCNREIKFGPFRDYALSLGADYIATGHFCGIEHSGGRVRLLKAADETKDQTYFLNQVRESQLAETLFPLSDMKKTEVRRLAEENGLSTAKKKDSTGICFIGERNFRKFLSQYLPAKKGEIRSLEGEVVGEHIGLMYYTLGQRKGLELGGKKGEDGRWFVVEKDLDSNVLYVSHGDEEPLMSDACEVSGLNWIGFEPEKSFECTAKFRYRQGEQPVRVTLTDAGARVDFKTRQRAVTEGQYAVFYDETACLGGGVIDKVIKNVK